MAKRLEQILIAAAIGLFLAVTVGIILRALFEIVAIFDLAEGDLTWGDIFTLMSIIAAGIIAGTGWFLARQNRRKEIERLAMVDAIILYRKLCGASPEGVGFLLCISAPWRGDVFRRFPVPISEKSENLLDFFKLLNNLSTDMYQTLPYADQFYDDLKSLYNYEVKFGDLFLEAIRSIADLKTAVKFYIDNPPQHIVDSFPKNRRFEISNFYYLVQCASRVSHNLASCCIELDLDLDLDVHYEMAEIAEYGDRFYGALGVDNPFQGEEITPGKFVELMKATDMIFGKAYADVQNNVHAK